MECCGNSNPSSTGCSSSTKKKKSKGVVKLSTDPQSVAARERRHRISDRFKILQSMVPGGSKMDTVSMLEEAIHYVKFLKTQIWLHETMINFVDDDDDPAALFLPYQPPLCSSQNNLVVDAVQPLPTVSFDETILSYDDAALKY